MMLNAVSKQYLPKLNKYLVILIGSLTWCVTMVKSGYFYSVLGINGPGLGFWGANGHDGIWHIALAESLSRGTLAMPSFAGTLLQNYHIGFDLLLVLLHKITTIPITNLYFQVLPPVFAILIGLLSYKFVFNWTNSDKSAVWSTFFVYFGGSLGWMLKSGESAFWSQQAISTLINPPFALSLLFLLLGLILLLKLEQKYSTVYFILAILTFGILIEIKAYAGLLALGGLFVTGVYTYVFNKQSLYLKIFLGALVLSVALFIPLNMGGASFLVFQPFWFLESMMGLADRVNYPKFYSAMLNYKAGHDFIKGTVAYGVAFAVFLFGNLGTRILSVVNITKSIKNIRNIGSLQVFIISIIFAGVVVPTLFVQKGTPWNTIQFFYYSLFFTSIFAGIAIADFIKNSKLNTSLLYSIEVLLIALTIPTTIQTLKDVYLPIRPPAMLQSSELTALKFLASQPPGIVLTHPFDIFESKNAENNPPRPLYLYTSTAYVSAFSKHQTYLEDEINLDIMGYDWEHRRDEVLGWYNEKEPEIAREFLRSKKINYIYWIKTGQSPLDLTKIGVENIFENESITIYKVDGN